MAKLTSAIEQGRIPKHDVLVFVMYTDLGDGSEPIIVLAEPQHLSGSSSDEISFVKSDSGISYKGSLVAVAGHKDMKRLSGALSAQPTPSRSMSGSTTVVFKKNRLTAMSGGSSSSVDAAGKRVKDNTQFFVYYN